MVILSTSHSHNTTITGASRRRTRPVANDTIMPWGPSQDPSSSSLANIIPPPTMIKNRKVLHLNYWGAMVTLVVILMFVGNQRLYYLGKRRGLNDPYHHHYLPSYQIWKNSTYNQKHKQSTDTTTMTSRRSSFASHRRRPLSGSRTETITYDTGYRRHSDSMSACLLIMDDNHFLVEWLAYHYQYLPLRRLIVAIDHRSATSPEEILNRYISHALIDISIWKDYMGKRNRLNRENITSQKNHLIRQNYFMADCLRRLKEENRSWVYMADTDELVFPNLHARSGSRISNVTHESTALATLKHRNNQDMNQYMGTPCFPIFKLDMGNKESTQEEVQRGVPPGFNGSNLFTFRYRWPKHHEKGKNAIGKSMIDLARVNMKDIKPTRTDPHRVLKDVCPKDGLYIAYDNSPFVVYHYAGAWEHLVYRRGVERARTLWKQLSTYNTWTDDTPRLWLQPLVDNLGSDLVQELLVGAGALPVGDRARQHA